MPGLLYIINSYFSSVLLVNVAIHCLEVSTHQINIALHKHVRPTGAEVLNISLQCLLQVLGICLDFVTTQWQILIQIKHIKRKNKTSNIWTICEYVKNKIDMLVLNIANRMIRCVINLNWPSYRIFTYYNL